MAGRQGLIVATLCVGMHRLTLCVTPRCQTRSVEGGVTTRSVGTIRGLVGYPDFAHARGPCSRPACRRQRPPARHRRQAVIVIVPTFRVGMHPLTLCVTPRQTRSVEGALPRGAWERSGGWWGTRIFCTRAPCSRPACRRQRPPERHRPQAVMVIVPTLRVVTPPSTLRV